MLTMVTVVSSTLAAKLDPSPALILHKRSRKMCANL